MKNKRLLSLGLTAVLIVSVCGCSKNTDPVEETVKETESVDAVEVAERVVSRSAGGDAEKEETVYVNADASGNVKNITVSSWLKNSNGATELTDVTKLKNIVNVKGDEDFTQDENTYIWAANGNDIYYQGETSEALPVDVKVSYYLDDNKITPEELAGKSGKVKIRFDYENHSTQKAMIGGEETELCVPFLAASTVILDSDKFVNVKVENGKIISDGKNTIVAGVAMPGLYDSLDLRNLEGFEDVDIPEYVEVTADVTEFELAMTATILMPDVFGELNTEDMDGLDDLKDDIEELNDATYDLIDGCEELDDGVQELKDNMPDLWDGAVELDDGAQELDDGAKELDDGAQDLMDGADKLNDGAKDIREGAKELDQGAGTLRSGIGLLNEKMPQLTGGADKLASGLQSLQNPMMLGPDGKSGDAEHPYIKTSVGQLKNGVDTLVAGVGSMGNELEQAIIENQKKMQAAEANVGVIKENLEQAVQEATVLQAQLTELAKQMGMISTENNTETEKAAEEISSSPEKDSTDKMENDVPTQTEDLVAVSENSGDQESGLKETAEADISKENADEDPSAGSEATIEKTTTVPEEAMEEELGASSETLMVEESSTTSEGSEPESTEEGEQTDTELSEFAKVYLEGLRKSEGMNYVSMVPMADQGKETAISDPGEVIVGYQKVVALQTDLISKLTEITTLQNQLREAATDYAGLVGADTALQQIAGQFSASADASQLAQLTEGMAALEASIGQIYDGIALINSQMGTLTTGASELKLGVGSLKDGADALKGGTKKLYQGGIDLREGTKELYEGTQDLKEGTEKLKDGTLELKDGTQELKDGVVDLVDGVDELKDGTEELVDGVHEYNDDGIQKLYDTVNVDLQNLLDRVDALADLSEAYQSFSGKSDAMKGSVKFIIETEAIEQN